jgi:alpha-beta hydrolase superfamily lysophospholipase
VIFQSVSWWKSSFAAFLLCGAVLFTAEPAFTQTQPPSSVKRSEILRYLPLTNFYDTPHPFPSGKIGELIRSESFDEYELPPEVSAIRILYHSHSASGENVTTSGVVLIPSEEKPPSEGWPIIAWAHGATGVARTCAPSLMRNLVHGPFLSMYVSLGYAVVATDYAGLGSNFRNAYLDVQSNATDVIASIPAARAAVPQLGMRWIVMGESEGSLAALAVAEEETEIHDPGYLGSIAISGVTDARDLYTRQSQMLPSGADIFLAYGTKTVYPQFQVTDILTAKALELYGHIQQDCWRPAASAEPTPGEMFKPGWENNEFVKQYFARNSVGHIHATGPILVISGDADRVVRTSLTAPIVERMCKQGDRVQWEEYSNLDPGRVIGDSVREQITWIEGRFAGRAAPGNCP